MCVLEIPFEREMQITKNHISSVHKNNFKLLNIENNLQPK